MEARKGQGEWSVMTLVGTLMTVSCYPGSFHMGKVRVLHMYPAKNLLGSPSTQDWKRQRGDSHAEDLSLSPAAGGLTYNREAGLWIIKVVRYSHRRKDGNQSGGQMGTDKVLATVDWCSHLQRG